MLGAIQVALTGLFAASKKVEASASNIANQLTAGALDDPDNAPYTPLTTTQKSLSDDNGGGLGVKAELVARTPPFVPAYDPGSPFANSEGLVGLPNVDLAEETVNLQMASTAYRANLKVIETASEMQEDLLNSFDRKA